MRVLVIEDEVETARLLCKGLREHGYEVEHAALAAQGLQMAQSRSWDLMIIDRMLPDEADALSIVRRLRALGRQTPLLVLSALTSLDERVSGLRSGGDDYLSKPFAFSELLARMEALLRRAGRNEEMRQLQVDDLTLDLSARRAQRSGTPIALQPREFRLLEFMVRRQGQVLTRTMLLEGVWDYHFDPQTNVIDVQISRLRNKIDRGFASTLLHTVRGVGYVVEPRPSQ